MRKATYYTIYSHSTRKNLTLEVEKVLSSPRGKQYCTLIFVDKSYKPQEYVRRDDLDVIPARCAILPEPTTGMLYAPSVINPQQIYSTIWQQLCNLASREQRMELIKLDNKIFSWSQKAQDLFVLEGLRFSDIKARQLSNFADSEWPAQPYISLAEQTA
jgi:hypothetical protein